MSDGPYTSDDWSVFGPEGSISTTSPSFWAKKLNAAYAAGAASAPSSPDVERAASIYDTTAVHPPQVSQSCGAVPSLRSVAPAQAGGGYPNPMNTELVLRAMEADPKCRPMRDDVQEHLHRHNKEWQWRKTVGGLTGHVGDCYVSSLVHAAFHTRLMELDGQVHRDRHGGRFFVSHWHAKSSLRLIINESSADNPIDAMALALIELAKETP